VRHDSLHYNFLASILSRTPPDVEVFSRSDWNWEEVIRIAADETILPPVSARLEELGIRDALPRDVSEFFVAYTALNAERNQRILHQIEEVASLLNRAGIEPVVLKGPSYLLTKVYENPAHRFILDIDLYVPETRIEDAFSILNGLGYSAGDPDPIAWAAHHLPALVHPDKIRVELHHSLGSGRCHGLLPPDEIFARSRRFQLGASTVRIPHPSDLMTHLIVHSQIHHGGDQRMWPPLRVQYDLVLLNRRFAREIDWMEIQDRFRRHRFLTVLQLHLLQVATGFESPPPFPLKLGPLGRLRWYRRRILWRSPGLRFVDPLFFLSSVTNVRPSFGRVLQAKGGIRFLLKPQFFGRVWRKVINSFRR
jgi:hypothetical protein